MTTCPICRDTGIAHSAPYLMGTAQGDLYTMTVCSCPAGKRAAAEVSRAVIAQGQKEGAER